jgi:small-conductance mechanosensitive channel
VEAWSKRLGLARVPQQGAEAGTGVEEPPLLDLKAWWEYELVQLGNQPIQVADLFTIAAVLLATFLLSRMVQRAMRRTFDRRGLLDEGTLTVAARLTHYAIMALGVFVALKMGGIPLTELFAAGALFAVVIGFAMQNIAENFVSGVILMVERSITPGDVLEVQGRMVRVIQMGIRATVARTRDEEELIIPNSEIVRSTVKNFTLGNPLFRLRAHVGVSYHSDLHAVRDALLKAADRVPFRHPEREPRVQLREFGSSSVDYDVMVWTSDPWATQEQRSILNEAIWWSLKEAGITIAFPQLDLHLDTRVENSLREAAQGH